jgi:hypothetical protein
MYTALRRSFPEEHYHIINEKIGPKLKPKESGQTSLLSKKGWPQNAC